MSALFEDYNARFSDLRTVGATFVLREKAFKSICGTGNTLILGPRGSGKTTLLKMMKISAQIAAKPTVNFLTLKSIKYRPVYLSADRLFEALTKGVDSENSEFGPILSSISKTLAAIRIKFSFLDTFAEMTDERTNLTPVVSHHFVGLTRTLEVEFCKLLCKTWEIEGDVINIKELRASLFTQISAINRLLDSYTSPSTRSESASLANKLFVDPITSAISFIDCFDSVFPASGKQWALCVDELEIMPHDLQDYFYMNLRSTDHRLLLKIATSPFTSAFSAFDSASPMDNNDYTSVNLSDAKKSESIKFTRQLVSEMVKREGHPGSLSVQAILGKSPITEENSDQKGSEGPYSSPRGAHYQRFRKLAGIDENFSAYLDRNQVNLEELDSLDESSRASKARQAIWQVALRLEHGANQKFRAMGVAKNRQNSRKTISSIYMGAESFLAMCEGNPRVTMGMFRTVLEKFRSNGSKVVSKSAQSEIIESTIAKYLSLLSAIALPLNKNKRHNSSVVTLLELIGEYCASQNLSGIFSPEPLSTFIVDDNLPVDIIKSFGAAINQGAFVMIEDKEKRKSYGRLQGARMRLSYLLCPRYKLPLTFGRSVPIQKILTAKKRGGTEATIRIKDLFQYHENI
jgi:energy-coupling factor transporter ATP-binding protein EcfA2